MSFLLHNQGDEKHLTKDEVTALLSTATRSSDGLMPQNIIFEGIWVKPPPRSGSPGREGMRAFDDNYFYYYFGDEWRRVSLSTF